MNMPTAINLPAIAGRKAEVKTALAVLEKAYPKETEILKGFINALATQDVRILGENELFVIRSKDGKKAVSVKRPVDLSLADGSLTKLGDYNDAAVLISAQGYEKLGEAANINVLNPPTVVVDGRDEHNPHVRRDENGMVTEVICRAIAVGYTATGMPAKSDRTSIFNIGIYRMVDLIGKAKKNPDHFKILPKEMKPESEGTWAKYPLDEATCLWADTSHKEYITWIGQSINRLKKAVEFAQTFAQRNAIKHHPSIARQKPPGNAQQWRTSVYGWLQNEGKFMYDESAAAEMDDGIIIEGVDRVEDTEEMQAAMDAEDLEQEHAMEQADAEIPGSRKPEQIGTEDPPFPKAPGEPAVQPANGGPKSSLELRQKLMAAIQFTNDETFKKAMAKVKVDPNKKILNMSEAEITAVINEMNRLVDEEGI